MATDMGTMLCSGCSERETCRDLGFGVDDCAGRHCLTCRRCKRRCLCSALGLSDGSADPWNGDGIRWVMPLRPDQDSDRDDVVLS